MEQPSPADGFPDRPLASNEAQALYDGDTSGIDDTDDITRTFNNPVQAIWVMDQDETVRGTVAPGADDDAVVDLVVETDTAYLMFSFSGGRWMDYGTQRKDDEDAPSMAGTLDSYRVLAGDPTPLDQ